MKVELQVFVELQRPDYRSMEGGKKACELTMDSWMRSSSRCRLLVWSQLYFL